MKHECMLIGRSLRRLSTDHDDSYVPWLILSNRWMMDDGCERRILILLLLYYYYYYYTFILAQRTWMHSTPPTARSRSDPSVVGRPLCSHPLTTPTTRGRALYTTHEHSSTKHSQQPAAANSNSQQPTASSQEPGAPGVLPGGNAAPAAAPGVIARARGAIQLGRARPRAPPCLEQLAIGVRSS